MRSGVRGAGGSPGAEETGEVAHRADVVVVGAGPAGSLAALLAAREGLSVLLVERAAFPRWKVCGACLNGAARGVLRDAGLGPLADRGAPLDALEIHGWGREARVPLQGSVALRRSVMDAALLDAARAAGARVVSGTVTDRGRVASEPGAPGSGDVRILPLRTGAGTRRVAGSVVVDATGLRGLRSLRSASPADGDGAPASWQVDGGSRIGVGAAFPPETPGWTAGLIHMVTGPRGYVGLVRTEDGGLNVAGALDPAFVREQGGPGPAVTAHLEAAGVDALPDEPKHGWQGTPALTRRPAALAAPRYLRVGDAAGYVEPFTGEGMAWALAGARSLVPLLVAGVESWSPALEVSWNRMHARRVGGRQRICRGVAWLSRRPGLARLALTTLDQIPWLARPLAGRTRRPFAPPPTLNPGTTP